MTNENYSLGNVKKNSRERYYPKLGIGGLSFDPSKRKEPRVPTYVIVGMNGLANKSRLEILIVSSKELAFVARGYENVQIQG